MASLTLLTDYGSEAGFVGALHLVAFRIAPEARVIDLDHSIPPGNVRLGALRLERFARLLPSGAHVGVVDPGVGGARRPIAIAVSGHYLVGPDNGLLVWAAERLGGPDRAVVLDHPEYHLAPRSKTFDGRDVFVPVAAHLLAGAPFDEVGSQIDHGDLTRVQRPVVTGGQNAIIVEVVQIDGFGNVQFGAGEGDSTRLNLVAGDRVSITPLEDGTGVSATFGATFGDVAAGEPVVLIDSDGQLALSVNAGRADRLLDARPGSRVHIARHED
jgi:S-adenosyl-L-methionine hydrolase (adenosine-forming)